MARKRVGQLGFGDGLVSGRGGRAADQLARISGLIDWPSLERVLAPVEPRATGKGMAGWPSLVLFRALLLQRWYDLSDEALEASLSDRLSFLRFIGLALSDRVPDAKTIWLFREHLARPGPWRSCSPAGGRRSGPFDLLAVPGAAGGGGSHRGAVCRAAAPAGPAWRAGEAGNAG